MKEHCRETLERAYLILDGEDIVANERAEIEHHLHECGPCYERYGLEVEVKRIIARLNGCTQCPDALREKMSDLFRIS